MGGVEAALWVPVKSKSTNAIHPVIMMRSASALSTLGGLKMSLGLNATQCGAMQMEENPIVHRHSTALRTAGVSLAVCATPLKIVAAGSSVTIRVK